MATRTTLSFHRDVTYPQHKNCNHTANTAESHSEETGGLWFAFNLTYQSNHAVKGPTDCQNILIDQSSLVVTRRAYCLGSSNKRSSHSELSPDCLQFGNEDGKDYSTNLCPICTLLLSRPTHRLDSTQAIVVSGAIYVLEISWPLLPSLTQLYTC